MNDFDVVTGPSPGSVAAKIAPPVPSGEVGKAEAAGAEASPNGAASAIAAQSLPPPRTSAQRALAETSRGEGEQR
jgi:hypothetical protein